MSVSITGHRTHLPSTVIRQGVIRQAIAKRLIHNGWNNNFP